jgi:TrpR-related protein YerC/YecD
MNKIYDKSIWQDKKAQKLVAALLELQNADELMTFLTDIMTAAEIKEFSNRLQAAQMLQEGNKYLDIQKVTGLSTTTIARISNWLQNGAGGYQTVLNRLNHIKPERAG